MVSHSYVPPWRNSSMKASKILLALCAVVAVLLTTASPAEAIFRVRVESGTTTGPGVVITDGAVGDTLFPGADGAIAFAGALGQYSIQFTLGTRTGSADGSGALAAPSFYDAIDIVNMTINSGGAGTLRIILEATGFSNAPDGSVILRNNVGGVFDDGGNGSTVTFESFANDDGTATGVPGLGPDVGTSTGGAGVLAAATFPTVPPAVLVSQSFTANSPTSFSGQADGNFTKTGTYSLYAVVTITWTAAGNISFNHLTGTLPAPGGLALVLTALPGLGLGYWRRLRKQTTVA
jgi:hypothetical protein